MMRADDLNFHGYPVRTEMTATKQIPTSRVFSTNEIKLKEFRVEKKNADQFHGRGQNKIHPRRKKFYGGRQIRIRSKNISKQKDAKNETDYE